MPSKSKTARLEQKAYWEEKLAQRLSALAEKGFPPEKIARDTAVKQLRARIRETGARLRVISEREKKAEEMARARAEKTAAPKMKKTKKTAEADAGGNVSKRQQKKQKKKAEKQGKK